MNSIIFFHAIFAILAITLGLLIFLKKKVLFLHKRLGGFWILFLVIVSTSAVFIQSLNPGQFSTIHLLIPFTLISLITAGTFTLMPGRIIHSLLSF